MDNSKTLIFEGNDGGSNGMMGLISALCQRQGLDPNMVMAMMNNRNGFGGEGGWFMWVIFLFFLMGWGGNGFGFGNRNGQGLADLGNLVNNDAGRELLMQAINGNGAAIGQLATTLNCDVNAINSALNGINSAICQVSNSVGLNSQAIINAIQSGNCSIARQLSECCCENRLAVANQTNTLQNAINFVNSSVERGFASTAYETAAQTCALQKSIDDGINKVLAGQQDALLREMQNKIDGLREKNQTLEFAASQQAQNAYLLAQLQPVPRPAYLTCSPYQAQMHPFAFMGYNPYGGYGYNGGCCGNNGGCGC